jgi:hypothetical protein
MNTLWRTIHTYEYSSTHRSRCPRRGTTQPSRSPQTSLLFSRQTKFQCTFLPSGQSLSPSEFKRFHCLLLSYYPPNGRARPGVPSTCHGVLIRCTGQSKHAKLQNKNLTENFWNQTAGRLNSTDKQSTSKIQRQDPEIIWSSQSELRTTVLLFRKKTTPVTGRRCVHFHFNPRRN